MAGRSYGTRRETSSKAAAEYRDVPISPLASRFAFWRQSVPNLLQRDNVLRSAGWCRTCCPRTGPYSRCTKSGDDNSAATSHAARIFRPTTLWNESTSDCSSCIREITSSLSSRRPVVSIPQAAGQRLRRTNRTRPLEHFRQQLFNRAKTYQPALLFYNLGRRYFSMQKRG